MPTRTQSGTEALDPKGKFYQWFPRMDAGKKNVETPREADAPFQAWGAEGWERGYAGIGSELGRELTILGCGFQTFSLYQPPLNILTFLSLRT